MPLYQWPFTLDLRLENTDETERPDAAFPLRIDARDLLRRADAPGGAFLDFASLRVADLHFIINGGEGFDRPERDCAVQFVPDPGFDPQTNPCGTLWLRLWKFPWQETNFPRHYRLYFDILRNGGKTAWTPNPESFVTPQHLQQPLPGIAQIQNADGTTALGFTCPPGRKPGFHPVTTPSGAVVTDQFTRDHIWHRGVWFAWTKIQSPPTPVRDYSFWGEPFTGVITDGGLTDVFSGPLVHGFNHKSVWATEDGLPLFDTLIGAQWQSIDNAWNFLDLSLTVTARAETVVLQTAYGHLTARAPALAEAYVLDSACADGETLRTNDHSATEVAWTGYSGTVAGNPVSLLLLDNPQNPGGRPHRDTFYEADRPFPIERGHLFVSIALNPIRDSPVTLASGESRTWHYRVVTSDRLLTPAFAHYHYRNYATPLVAVW